MSCALFVRLRKLVGKRASEHDDLSPLICPSGHKLIWKTAAQISNIWGKPPPNTEVSFQITVFSVTLLRLIN